MLLKTYVVFIPKINFTILRNPLGTFFTTIVILFLPYLENKYLIPPINIPIPIMNIQAHGGRNNIKSVATPKPINIPAIIFLNLQKNILSPPFLYNIYELLF